MVDDDVGIGIRADAVDTGPQQDLGMFTPGEDEFHSVTGWTVGEARLEART